jgi:serine phosphatase RsbU (regulator of sigma subunit)/pSer/pThr/pTyr-binding forkhead associated (FHA) protein
MHAIAARLASAGENAAAECLKRRSEFPPMAILQLFKGSAPSQDVVLDGDRAVLGRHPDCDIVLEAASVSRQHAQIVREGDVFYVEDLHSRNGTYVNGRLIQGRHLLQDGDRLKICDLGLAFYFNQPSDRLPTSSDESASSLALMVDDAGPIGTSTIVSKLDVTSSRSGVRLTVNPEVKLRAMIEIAQNLGKAVSLDEVLGKLLDSLFKIFIQADRGFVILRTPEGVLVPKAVRHRRPDMEDQARISRTIVNQVMNSKEAVLSADAANDSRFDTSQSIADLRIRSMMCAPLVDSDGNSLGVIQVDTGDQRQRFQKDDLDVLASIASQAAIAVDNAQLHENALRQQAIEHDLELAHKVQRDLLPAAPPQVDGYYFFDFYEAANQVGGDYYDYIELPDNRIAVVLGDVSGKGVAAALVMAKLSGGVRFYLASEGDPAVAMSKINASFSRSGWQDRFVTMVLAVLDARRHEITLVNAGHMAPFLRHGEGRVEPIGEEQAGLPLGVDADFEYQSYTRAVAPGDVLALFTDGFSEAMNAGNELYGLDRLSAQLANPSAPVAELGKMILADVKQFVGGRPQSDDMCLACFGRVRA